jgi:hypothetical protein
VLKLSVWPEMSMFDSAMDLVTAYTGQSNNLSAFDFLAFFGLSLHFSKVNRNRKETKSLIKVTHSRIYNMKLFPRQYQAHEEHSIIAGFRSMCGYLVKFVAASYEDKREQDFDFKQSKPAWLDPDKFYIRGQKLIRLLQISLMVVDYVFEFTKQHLSNDLVYFAQQVFSKSKNFASHYRVLDYILRVISNEEAIRRNKELLDKCRNNPSQTESYFKSKEYNEVPEEYRDALVTQIRKTFLKRKNFFWSGDIRTKDILIVRWKVLLLNYRQPDKTALMFLKGGSKADKLFQLTRHQNICNKYHISTDDLRNDNYNKEGNDDNDNDDNNDDEDSDDNDDNKEEEESEESNSNVDKDTNCDNIKKNAKNCFGFGDPQDEDDDDEDDEDNKDNKTDQDDAENGEGDKTNNDDNRDDQRHDDNDLDIEEAFDPTIIPKAIEVTLHETSPFEENVASHHTNETNETRPPTLVIESQKHLKMIGPIKKKDKRELNLLLTYTTNDCMTKYIQLGPIDVLYHRGLDVVPHKVISMEEESLNLRFDPKKGHAWYPCGVSSFNFDFGIIRDNHELLHSQLSLLKGVNFDLVFEYLLQNGKKDTSRDGAVYTWRINIGTANHNYGWTTAEKIPFQHFRDKPRCLCGIPEILSFTVEGQSRSQELKKSLSIILKLLQSVIDEAYRSKGLTIPLQNAFQYYTFTEKWVKILECENFRFSTVNLGITKIRQLKQPTVVIHEDGLNGIEIDNDLSGTFHFFFRGKNPDNEEESLYRFYVIGYTRKSGEDFEANEALLGDLKDNIKQFQVRVNRSYEMYRPFMGEGIDFTTPHKLWLPTNLPWQVKNLEEHEYRCITVSTSYCREVNASAGLTILRRAYVKIGHAKKMMELMLVALFCGSWTKFYLTGIAFLDSATVNWEGNLAVQFVSMMNSMFQNWRGGEYHRGRTTAIDFIKTYSDPCVLAKAVEAMFKFLSDLETAPPKCLELMAFKDMVEKMTQNISGIHLFYGQNLAFYAACTGIILKDNAWYGTYAFPVPEQGSQREIDRQSLVQTSLAEKHKSPNWMLETLKLDSSIEGFKKTTRLFCQFCNLEDWRFNWAECGFCDGLGRTSEYMDTLYENQSIFWLFHDTCTDLCIAKEKKFGTRDWIPLLDVENT